jgi:hypothetical protein
MTPFVVRQDSRSMTPFVVRQEEAMIVRQLQGMGRAGVTALVGSGPRGAVAIVVGFMLVVVQCSGRIVYEGTDFVQVRRAVS